MVGVSRRPAARNHPSSAQEIALDDCPLLELDDNEQERHALAQVDNFGRVNVSFSANDECNEHRPQLDNPSQLMPDNDDDHALKEHMASQEEANRNEQEAFKEQLESEFQLNHEANSEV